MLTAACSPESRERSQPAERPARTELAGTDADDLALTGTEADEEVRGYGGSDILDGIGGSDILEGGPGSDLMKGGPNDDVFVYGIGDGLDIIDDRGGNDELRFEPGITPDDLTFAERGGLTIARKHDPVAARAGYNIFIQAWGDKGQYIEAMRFSDGAVLDVDGVRARVQGNHAPVPESPILTRTVSVGSRFEVDVAGVFRDPDGDELFFVASSEPSFPLPDWLSFDRAAARLAGTPSAPDVGEYRLVLFAGDDHQAGTGVLLLLDVKK